MNLSVFPVLNASLNALCAILLLIGRRFIKKNNMTQHRRFMVSAFLTSIVFLASYLYYHAHVGSKHYDGTGWMRPLYFSILISHTILAAAIVPLVIITLTWATRGNFEKHRRWARWTWPVWMYVSVTGVVIYAMLYL